MIAFFKYPTGADRARHYLMRSRHKNQLIDACSVVRFRDGALEMHQTKDRVDPAIIGGLLIGAISGMLVGWMIWTPMAGLVLGTLAGMMLGSLWGMLHDYGIEDDMIERLGTYLKPETSALFLLFRGVLPRTLLADLKQAEATIIHTPLNARAEEALRKKLKHLQREVSPAHLPVYTVDTERPRPHAR